MRCGDLHTPGRYCGSILGMSADGTVNLEFVCGKICFWHWPSAPVDSDEEMFHFFFRL